MLMLGLALTSVLSLPLLLIALAAKSALFAWIAGGFGLLGSVLVLSRGFALFFHEMQPKSADEVIETRLQKLWRESGPERTRARFWVYPESGANFKVWVKHKKNLEIFLSQGLLNLATDEQIKNVFHTLSQSSLSDIQLQNRRHALTSRLSRLKGPSSRFRYWIVSFWFYNLERLLKIAKI